MTISVREFKKILDRSGDAHLTLLNDEGETYCAGNPQQVTHVGTKLKMKWPIEFESHAYPFHFAVVHQENKILIAKEITPVSLDPKVKTLELVFDYN